MDSERNSIYRKIAGSLYIARWIWQFKKAFFTATRYKSENRNFWHGLIVRLRVRLCQMCNSTDIFHGLIKYELNVIKIGLQNSKVLARMTPVLI